MYKDVRLCVEEGEALGVPMPIAGAVHQMWLMANAAARAGLGLHRDHQDHRAWAGVEVRARRGDNT